MKHIKKFENNYNTVDIEKIIPKEEIYAVFEKYSLSCDPRQNKHLNKVEYNKEDNVIICSYSCYTYDGRAPKNIFEVLQKIGDEINASYVNYVSFYSKSGSYMVTFIYTDERLKEIEIKKNSDKYNL